MKKENLPFVVAIAGVSGAGKTTIAKYLNESLLNSKILYFDDYDFDGPDSIIDWVDKGANYDEWNLTPLIRDKTSKMIDFAVFIDTPLDIAMARRVIRDFENSSNENIVLEMKNYISQGRRGYLEMLKTIKPNSNITVDGTLSVVKIADIIHEQILSR